MSKDLENKTKKELVEIIHQLTQKLSEMQGVEAKQEASESLLPGKGFSVVQNLDNSFGIVEISFDIATKVGKIDSVKPLHSNSYDVALYEAKRYLVENIMAKKNLNHLKEK
jgi:hypothetical protein